jgi:hypothetical protein
MTEPMTVRFEEALARYLGVVRTFRDDVLRDAGSVVVVRDLMGRLRLAMDRCPANLDAFFESLRDAAGPFFGEGVLEKDSMIAPKAVFESPDLVDSGGRVWLLERVVTGAEFGRGPLPSLETPRATLYGIKGGVGRSTALCVWARHLAALGERVLVIDLDLESPGVSSLLLPADARPDFGIVDWLVEDAVGNADEQLVRLMVSPNSPLAQGTGGDILVAPCGGTRGEDYMAKLSRAYVDIPRDGHVVSFAERLASMICALETEHRPTVVLLDSRAGLHDLAGIATTRLDAMTFLFAVGGRQTWDAYGVLLRKWASWPAIARAIRLNLHVVAAQIPEIGRQEYLERLEQDAYDAFSDTFYEEAAADDSEAFNFDISSDDAPHYPLRIHWGREFQDWDPAAGAVSDEQIRASFGEFVDRATALVLDGREP